MVLPDEPGGGTAFSWTCDVTKSLWSSLMLEALSGGMLGGSAELEASRLI